MIDVHTEIMFKTARSGGKGGQNVNKVETMVEGYFSIANSRLLTPEQKAISTHKLSNKITSEGFLLIKSQEHRTQLQNKLTVIKKMNATIAAALKKVKKRIATKPSKAAKAKRVEYKKKEGLTKAGRKKIRLSDL